MTPREFLAVALMLATNYDERMMLLSEHEAEEAQGSDGRAYWLARHEEDAQRVGARRALWLEITG